VTGSGVVNAQHLNKKILAGAEMNFFIYLCHYGLPRAVRRGDQRNRRHHRRFFQERGGRACVPYPPVSRHLRCSPALSSSSHFYHGAVTASNSVPTLNAATASTATILVLFWLAVLLAALSLMWHVLPKEPRSLKRMPFYRFGGIIIVALFAAWNWINPARIAPTTEAVFTWSFYAFQVLTVLWIIAGVLGARYYAQYPERN
jgi:hypothetical protein